MSDPFDDFAAEMARRTARVQQEEAQSRKPRFSEQDQRDRAVISAMASMPLKPGQMLLLGPQSVRLLSTPGAYAGSLPDKLVLEKAVWNALQS